MTDPVSWFNGLNVEAKHLHALERWVQHSAGLGLRAQLPAGLLRLTDDHDEWNAADSVALIQGPSPSGRARVRVTRLRLLLPSGRVLELKDMTFDCDVHAGSPLWLGLSDNEEKHDRDVPCILPRREVLDAVPIARAVKRDGSTVLDPEYLPPCATMESHQHVAARARKILGEMRAWAKAAGLVVRGPEDGPCELATAVRQSCRSGLLILGSLLCAPSEWLRCLDEVLTAILEDLPPGERALEALETSNGDLNQELRARERVVDFLSMGLAASLTVAPPARLPILVRETRVEQLPATAFQRLRVLLEQDPHQNSAVAGPFRVELRVTGVGNPYLAQTLGGQGLPLTVKNDVWAAEIPHIDREFSLYIGQRFGYVADSLKLSGVKT